MAAAGVAEVADRPSSKTPETQETSSAWAQSSFEQNRSVEGEPEAVSSSKYTVGIWRERAPLKVKAVADIKFLEENKRNLFADYGTDVIRRVDLLQRSRVSASPQST